MRLLSELEQNRLKALTEKSVEITLIEPTETGLKKSIMDATGSVRSYLKRHEFHDYDTQGLGPECKVFIDSEILNIDNVVRTRTSLYRPKTKFGDPRIWIYKLTKFSDPNDIIGLIAFRDKIEVINLTRLPIEELINASSSNPIKELVLSINETENNIANELLEKLKEIAQLGFIPSLVNADTSVGRTLETALGININSSKLPDYKGIELKAFRNSRVNRKNLFAQVPDWSLSKFKSSAEILNNFGYARDDDFKLYCTVSAIHRNPQSLQLSVDRKLNWLLENSNRGNIGDFVVWTLDKLHNRLLEKHNETFWISAECKHVDGKECFQYQMVEHTRKPLVSQFDLLLEQGIITVDHLIKKNSKGKVVEKGPLFKIKPNSLDLLFPPSTLYDLI